MCGALFVDMGRGEWYSEIKTAQTYLWKVLAVRRFFLVMMGILLAVSLLGCTEKKIEESPKNDVFTDDYFVGLKEMSLMGIAGPLSGEEMEPVIDLLQKASLTQLQDGVKVEGEGTAFLLVMEFEEGVYKTVQLSNKTVAPGALESIRYTIDSEVFVEEILNAFNVPVEEF